MTKEEARMLADWMLTKERLVERTQDNFKENKRYNPYYSELRGMESVLKALNIPFEYEHEYDESINDYKVVALTVKGQRVTR